MKAIVLRNKGSANQLKYEEVEVPKINDNEVLVKIKAASVNHLDIWVREGQFRVKYPLILGCEAAGDIVEIGKNVKGFKKNDKVLVTPKTICSKCEYCLEGNDNLCGNSKVLGLTADGCYAEYAKVPQQNLILIGKLGYEEAASVPVAYGTAYRAVATLAKLKPKETALITAAGSGVGTGAVQIAKLAGAVVIAAAGNGEKLEKIKSIGADFTVDYYRNLNFDEEVKCLTNGNGVDVVIEQVGGAIFAKSMKCIKKNGRIAVFGATAGAKAEFDIQHFYRNNLSMFGSSGATKKEIAEIFELVKKGRIKPVIDKRFPLKDAALAHKYMEERKNFGKIILKP